MEGELVLKKPKDISLKEKKFIIREWLEGGNYKDLGKKYGISTRGIRSIVEREDTARTDIEKRYLSVANARDNVRIANTKDKVIAYVEETISRADSDESMTTTQRIKYLNSVASILERLDTISRLNQDKPTENSKTTTVTADIAEILKQLKTPEDKMAFLQKQTNDRVYENNTGEAK